MPTGLKWVRDLRRVSSWVVVQFDGERGSLLSLGVTRVVVVVVVDMVGSNSSETFAF